MAVPAKRSDAGRPGTDVCDALLVSAVGFFLPALAAKELIIVGGALWVVAQCCDWVFRV